MLSQPKSAVHQQAAKLFQQHWRHLKGNYDLNSAFENADRLPENKSVPAVSFTILRFEHYKAKNKNEENLELVDASQCAGHGASALLREGVVVHVQDPAQ
jgi:hypothetical protein